MPKKIPRWHRTVQQGQTGIDLCETMRGPQTAVGAAGSRGPASECLPRNSSRPLRQRGLTRTRLCTTASARLQLLALEDSDILAKACGKACLGSCRDFWGRRSQSRQDEGHCSKAAAERDQRQAWQSEYSSESDQRDMRNLWTRYFMQASDVHGHGQEHGRRGWVHDSTHLICGSQTVLRICGIIPRLYVTCRKGDSEEVELNQV